LALVPVLWGSGMGSELQRPLALTVIGGMVLGTVVSLYFIPLCYYYLMRRKRERGKEKQKRPERAI
jgi:Cu/Ag efflux pump CusA